jgi:fructoselysine-6-P-deglycase FrlB-like protein
LQELHGARIGARSGKANQGCRYNHGTRVENVARNGGVLMAAELREAPDVVARQSELLVRPLGELAAMLKRMPPRVVVTCVRGSSGHAENFGKHLIERHLGIPVAAVAGSIAATKTFVASVAILLNLIAHWVAERAINAALDRLPERLAAVAAELDWAKAVCSLSATNNLAILGRGPTLAIAQEASLKLKEVQKITWTR